MVAVVVERIAMAGLVAAVPIAVAVVVAVLVMARRPATVVVAQLAGEAKDARDLLV